MCRYGSRRGNDRTGWAKRWKDGRKARRQEIAPLNLGEAQALLQAAKGDRLEALYVIALSLVLRLGEALALRWSDVDLEARTLRVNQSVARIKGAGLVFADPKTEKSRASLPLSESLVGCLREH